MEKYGVLIAVSILLGTAARIYTLRTDYRQYPSYPHAYVTHLTLGFIAAALGGLAIPALLEENYVAVTFLTVAAQQFRDIRNMERDTLAEIEETELVPRGKAYIEGIAKLFESRNYLAMINAFVTSLVIHYLGLIPGVIIGILFPLLLTRTMIGPRLKDIAVVEKASITFKGKNIGIEDVIMMNVGEDEGIENWKKYGIGLVIKPKDDNARATLANIGQRQAILHDVATQLGIKLDVGIQQYTPLARLDLETGRVCMIIIPIEPDIPAIIEAINKVPVLESAQRKPLQSKAGKMAAD
ncbi:MAG: YIEGIA family protein [Halanaerobiales bacterium]|nr:YIEGIA family protein [Halanaerobiales bacterium]